MAAINCQSSYPLNSEKARPPGTCSEYLSCAASAIPAKREGNTTMATADQMLVGFILDTLLEVRRSATGPARRCARAFNELRHNNEMCQVSPGDSFATRSLLRRLLTRPEGRGFNR